MSEAFRLGGWGMYPITIAGLVLIATSARYAIAPDPRRLALTRRLMLLTVLVSLLGFTAGMIRCLISAADLPGPEVPQLVAVGAGEALNTIGLGLGMLVLGTIGLCVGAARTGTDRGASTLTDPHQP